MDLVRITDYQIAKNAMTDNRKEWSAKTTHEPLFILGLLGSGFLVCVVGFRLFEKAFLYSCRLIGIVTLHETNDYS